MNITRVEKSEYDRRYYQKNKEARKERDRKYYQDNRERMKEYGREYSRKYYLTHREEAREYCVNNIERARKCRIERKIKKPWVSHFKSAKERCNNHKAMAYKYYGGKGIECLLTEDGVKTIYLRDNARDMIRPSIDRIDRKGNYVFSNCQFIELSENLKRRWENR